jgi:site-specific DNA-methyltransferase (cytosine-N4-specific)
LSVYYQDESVTLYHGDSLDVARTLPDGSADCIVTSPPYFGLRDYGTEGQYGLEASPAEYVETMRSLFNELRRVLADDGTFWLNLGDSYASGGQSRTLGRNDAGRDIGGRGGNTIGSGNPGKQGSVAITQGMPQKNLLGIPWRVAFALQDDGWILRNSIIWAKPNAMPESVTDRLSTRHENLFMFAKSRKYWFDLDPIREELAYPDATDGSRVFGGKNKGAELQTGSSARRAGMNTYTGSGKGKNPGDVWSIPTQPYPGAHFAVFPQELARRCIVAGCKPGGTVLDPFSGSGTTGLVAQNNGRRYIGIDISAEYLDLSLKTRLQNATLDLGGIA